MIINTDYIISIDITEEAIHIKTTIGIRNILKKNIKEVVFI